MGWSIDAPAPSVERSLDSRVVASKVLEIAAQLAQAPAETERSILEWAFARIGALVHADVVAVREVRSDGQVHFVGGWSRLPNLLDGPQKPMRLRRDELTREQISTTRLDEMPILPPADELKEWRKALALSKFDSPQSVFTPLVAGVEPTGYLCMVARPGVTWDELMLESFAIAAALLAQFRARVRAELALQQQLAFSDLLRSIAERLLTIVPGEEWKEIEESLRDIGEFLDLISIGLWELQHDETVALSHRWLASDVQSSGSVDFVVAKKDVPDALLDGGSRGKRPMSGAELGQFTDLVNDVSTEREFLILPLATHTSGGAIVVGARPGREWRPWERSGLGAFASHLPTLRARLEAEEQLVAAFHAAPIGIVIRDDSQRLVDCNEAFSDFLGYSSELALLRTETSDILAAEWAIDFANELATRPPSQTEPVELPFRHTSGRTVWGRLSFRSMHIGTRPMVLTHIEDVTNERANRLELERRTLHDELTGVANRRQMHIALERLLRNCPDAAATDMHHVALLMLDLDGFKQVNDQHGHLVGDEVLREISRRIVAASRDTDVVVRLGGDEFVVILPGPIKIEHSQRAADRIRTAVAEPLAVNGIEICLTVSIGAAVPAPGVASVEDLLATADRAMYEAKVLSTSGRGGGHHTAPPRSPWV